MKSIAVKQKFLAWLAQQDLTGEQFKVLFYLFGKLNFDNYLRVPNKEIAEWVNIDPANVSKALKALKELEIILEGPRAGLYKTYRLNPEITPQGTDELRDG